MPKKDFSRLTLPPKKRKLSQQSKMWNMTNYMVKYLPFANCGERKNFTTYRINFVYIKGDKLRPNGNEV